MSAIKDNTRNNITSLTTLNQEQQPTANSLSKIIRKNGRFKSYNKKQLEKILTGIDLVRIGGGSTVGGNVEQHLDQIQKHRLLDFSQEESSAAVIPKSLDIKILAGRVD